MKRPRDVSTVIDEMLDHIDYILGKVGHLSAAELQADRDTRQSVERSLEIISEASRHIPEELKKTRSEIPWPQVADFGNVLRHTYFAVNTNVVWRIAVGDLPTLRVALNALRDKQ
jgi:uncharacterized protein with HEPN domain